MTIKLESEIEGAVSEWCTERNILHAKFSPFGRAGYQDHVYFIYGGRPVLIEYKRPGEELRKLQKHYYYLLKELGYDVAVAQTKLEAITYLFQAVRSAYARKKAKA